MMKTIIISLLFLAVGEAALIGCLAVDNVQLQLKVNKYAYALSD